MSQPPFKLIVRAHVLRSTITDILSRPIDPAELEVLERDMATLETTCATILEARARDRDNPSIAAHLRNKMFHVEHKETQ